MATPYRDRVIDFDALPLLREVVAALLILAGAVGLVVIAFRVNDTLGWALVCLLAIGAGASLALSRS